MRQCPNSQEIMWFLVQFHWVSTSRSARGLLPIRMTLGEYMGATRRHAGQGPVLRDGFVMGGGEWRVRGRKGLARRSVSLFLTDSRTTGQPIVGRAGSGQEGAEAAQAGLEVGDVHGPDVGAAGGDHGGGDAGRLAGDEAAGHDPDRGLHGPVG